MREPLARSEVVAKVIEVVSILALIFLPDLQTETIVVAATAVVAAVEAIKTAWARARVTPIDSPAVPEGVEVRRYQDPWL